MEFGRVTNISVFMGLRTSIRIRTIIGDSKKTITTSTGNQWRSAREGKGRGFG